MHGKWEYFRKSHSKTGPEKSVIMTGVRTTEVNTWWTTRVKMGMLEKWSEMECNGEKEARKGGLGLGHHILSTHRYNRCVVDFTDRLFSGLWN